MNVPDLAKNKIREELQKGLPSKRKILSYLLDLVNNDKYPSLSDTEFYDIVGATYKLNLKYKLNLEMLFYPIYKNLKKKINKLYGNEKRLEMEQYLRGNFDLYYPEKKENIGQIQYSSPSFSKIIRYAISLLVLILGIIILIWGITLYFSLPLVSFFGRGFVIVLIAAGISLIIVSILIVSR